MHARRIGLYTPEKRIAAADIEFYTVFDPDDGSEIVYRWYGGSMVNIFDSETNTEVDVFTIGEPEKPTIEDVQNSINDHHESVLEELAGEDEEENASGAPYGDPAGYKDAPGSAGAQFPGQRNLYSKLRSAVKIRVAEEQSADRLFEVNGRQVAAISIDWKDRFDTQEIADLSAAVGAANPGVRVVTQEYETGDDSINMLIFPDDMEFPEVEAIERAIYGDEFYEDPNLDGDSENGLRGDDSHEAAKVSTSREYSGRVGSGLDLNFLHEIVKNNVNTDGGSPEIEAITNALARILEGSAKDDWSEDDLLDALAPLAMEFNGVGSEEVSHLVSDLIDGWEDPADEDDEPEDDGDREYDRMKDDRVDRLPNGEYDY